MELMNSLNGVFDEIGLRKTSAKIAGILAIIASLFFMYTALMGSFPAMTQRGVLLALTLPMIFLLIGSGIDSKFGRILDIVSVIIAAVPFIYIVMVQDQLMSRGGMANTLDVIMGFMAILVVLEGTRRKVGNALPIIAIIFILYAILGPYMPNVIMHRGMDVDMLVSSVFLGEEGIFGIPIAVTADFIMIFVIFGAFLSVSGAGEFFGDIANAAFGGMRGGPAKAATMGSGLMGMISGSAVANVMTVGNFTIPLMKRTGYSPEMAGAIEAVASTGGQIMPPIMGAAAFIMAEFLKVPYSEIIIAAAIPAALYYISLFFMVDLAAGKNNLLGVPRADLPDWKVVLKKSWYLLIPVGVLIYMLGFMGYSPQKSAISSIVCLFIVAAFGAHTRLNLRKTIKAIIQGAIGGLEVAAVCASAGIVIGILMRTGLGLSLTGILVDASQGSLPVLMVLTMFASIILGMGLPTSACYIIVAVLIAPAMVQMGVTPIAAHLFAFFFGCLSAITPPVALAAYAAAGIAQSNPMKTGIFAAKMGLGAFIIPFAFVYGNALLMVGTIPEIVLAFITATMGVYAVAIFVIGFQFSNVPWVFRILSLVSAVCLIIPGWKGDLLGFAILAFISIINYLSNKSLKSSILVVEGK